MIGRGDGPVRLDGERLVVGQDTGDDLPASVERVKFLLQDREWDKVWEVARSGVTPGVAMPELNEAAARKSSNPANPRTGQHGSANSCLPRFVPLSHLRDARGYRGSAIRAGRDYRRADL